MSDNVIDFRSKKFGVDYHREEMERRGAKYIDRLPCNSQQAIAWLTSKGVLYSEFDDATGRWVHEWHGGGAA